MQALQKMSEPSIPLVRLLDGHHGKNMHFLLRFMDAVESRECVADVEPVGVLPLVHMQAFLITPAAGIRIFLKGFQSFHDDTPAFRAETPDALEGFSVNQNPERQSSAPQNPLRPRCGPYPQ